MEGRGDGGGGARVREKEPTEFVQVEMKVVEPGSSAEATFTIERRKFAVRPVTSGVAGKTGCVSCPALRTPAPLGLISCAGTQITERTAYAAFAVQATPRKCLSPFRLQIKKVQKRIVPFLVQGSSLLAHRDHLIAAMWRATCNMYLRCTHPVPKPYIPSLASLRPCKCCLVIRIPIHRMRGTGRDGGKMIGACVLQVRQDQAI